MNEENLRTWITNQEKIAKLKQMLAGLEKAQDALEQTIMNSVPEGDLAKVKVKISGGAGGSIRFREVQSNPSLTQKFLLSSLEKYYKGSNEADTVFRFILSERVPKKKWIIQKLKL